MTYLKPLVAVIAPLLYNLRMRVVQLIVDGGAETDTGHSVLLFVDVSLLLVLAFGTLIFWCCVVRRAQEITWQLIMIVLALWAGVFGLHAIVAIVEQMNSAHATWYEDTAQFFYDCYLSVVGK